MKFQYFISDQSWSTFQVSLYLRGENKAVDDHVSVFLFNDCDWMVKTRFSVSVKDNSLGTVRFSLGNHPDSLAHVDILDVMCLEKIK